MGCLDENAPRGGGGGGLEVLSLLDRGVSVEFDCGRYGGG